jgi:hypothetical protein
MCRWSPHSDSALALCFAVCLTPHICLGDRLIIPELLDENTCFSSVSFIYWNRMRNGKSASVLLVAVSSPDALPGLLYRR